MSGGIDAHRRDAEKFYTKNLSVLCASAVNPILDSAFDMRISDLIFEGQNNDHFPTCR